MPVAWPAGVPHYIMQGADAAPFRAPQKTDMEDGPPRQRRSSTKNVATLRFTVPMLNAEFAIFKAWVRDDLVDGTLAFTMSVWTGAGYEAKTCTFVERYGDRAYRPDHLVSFVIDVEDY